MTEEEKYIINSFDKNFLNKKIAIYGIGKNTKLIIDTFPNASIVGLMDEMCKESTIYGKKILTNTEIVGNVDTILIVARRAVQGIIYPRIKKYKDYGIKIVDIEGKSIEEEEYLEHDIQEWYLIIEDVKKRIDSYECISFDLFDTLLMRKFLFPSDVFETMVRRNQFINSEKFVKVRCSLEKKGMAFKNIKQLYEEIAYELNFDKEQKNILMNLELEIEKENIVARKKVVELLEYARSRKKKVFILTDMYYAKEELKYLCDSCGIIIKEDEIISSCDIGMSKEMGTSFQYLINIAKTKSILHIGDNVINDFQMAKSAGIDSVRILSGYEMLLHSSLSSMLSRTDSYAKRCLLGTLAAEIFNDPFVLNNSKGKVSITDLRSIGYFFGSIFYSFSCWLVCEANLHDIEQMILPGRDGYLIKKILDILNPQFKYVYIKASRRAYELATISDNEDIINIKKKDYKGTKKEFYSVRFNIEINDNETEKNVFQRILDEASYQRKCLLNYFKQEGIESESKKGIFDCVASGTVHSCLEELINCKMRGFYFGVVLPKKAELTIESAFGEMTSYKIDSKLLENYLIIENLLSENCGTFIGFHNNQMLFENNSPSEKLILIQKGILDYVEDAFSLFKNFEYDLEFCNEIMEVIFNNKINISDDIKELFYYSDSYLGENTTRIWR